MSRSTRLLPPRIAALRWSTLVAGVVLLAWTLVAGFLSDEMYDGYAAVSSVVVLGGAIGAYIWQAPPGQEGLRLLALFVCGQTFLSSGLSILSPPETAWLQFTASAEAFSFAVEASVIFSLMFLAGTYITGPRANQDLPDPPSPQVGPRRSVLLLLACTTAAISVYVALTLTVDNVGRLGVLPLILFNMGLIAPMVAATATLTGRSTRIEMAIVLGGQGLVTFLSSMLGIVVFTMRDIVLAQIYLRRRLPLGLIAATLLVLAVLNPAKTVFRTIVASERSSAADISVEEAFGVWNQAIEITWSDNGPRRDPNRNYESTTRRLDYNWLSAHVYSTVPNQIPFEMGGTYEDIPLMFVPRIIYPDKPNSATYTRSRWLVKLGIQNRQTIELAAIALPAPAEAYWNFGWAGVLLVPLFVGMATGGMLRLGPKDPVGRVAYVVLLVTNLGQYLDMLVWVVPQFAVVAVSSLLARVYCQLGKKNPPQAKYEVPAAPTRQAA